MANTLTPLTVSPPVIVLTLVQKQQKVFNRINSDSQTLFKQMVSTFNTDFGFVWANPDGLTPQQVCDGFGTNAVEVFRRAGILATAINEITANSVVAVTPKTVTPNPDGTVTIGA